MNWEVIISAFVIVIGWFIGHLLSSKRNRDNKRRELQISYLIEAWRNLEDCTIRNDLTRASIIEKAIADVNLFGSKRQIDLAQKFSKEFAESGKSDLNDLLEDLRHDLRKELQLQHVSTRIHHLRITLNDDNQKKK
jgi:hypothetical protein